MSLSTLLETFIVVIAEEIGLADQAHTFALA